LEFALLSNAQQLALQIERQIADFIQEYGAAVHLFESPDAALQGPVNVSRAWLKSSASSRFSGRAVQFTAPQGSLRRGLAR